MKFLVLLITLNLTACNPAKEFTHSEPLTPPTTEKPEPPSNNTSMVITINNTSFDVTLFDNATALAFKQFLPMSMTMHDMNANEKYATLPQSLPTSITNVATINRGDIMLYGSNTIVIFYKTFANSYSYTRIGRVDDASSLASVMGSGSVDIKFELK